VLGLQPLRVFRFLRSEPTSPFWGKQEEKTKFFFLAALFLEQILGEGKICPSTLNWYLKTEIPFNITNERSEHKRRFCEARIWVSSARHEPFML